MYSSFKWSHLSLPFKKQKKIHQTELNIILWQISKKEKIDLLLLKHLPVCLHTVHVHYTDS